MRKQMPDILWDIFAVGMLATGLNRLIFDEKTWWAGLWFGMFLIGLDAFIKGRIRDERKRS